MSTSGKTSEKQPRPSSQLTGQFDLNEILERISDAFLALDNKWRYTYMNKKAGEIFNRDARKIIGKNIWKEFPEEIDQPFYRACQEAMERQKYIHVEECYQPYNLWFENHIYPSPKGLSIFLRDITEKKRAEETALESKRRYQTLAESSPVGIFHTDASGYTTYVNKRWCQISGSSLEKAIGNGWFNAVHIDDKEKLINGWQQATKIEGISFSEYRFVRPDGTTAWVMGQATPERNQENQIVGYIGTITDITDRKTAEQVISASEEKYRTLVEQASDAIFLFDYDGNFLDLNTSAVKLSGYTREELLERTIHDLSIEDDIKMKPGCPLTTGLTLAKNVVYQ